MFVTMGHLIFDLIEIYVLLLAESTIYQILHKKQLFDTSSSKISQTKSKFFIKYRAYCFKISLILNIIKFISCRILNNFEIFYKNSQKIAFSSIFLKIIDSALSALYGLHK